MAFRTSRAKQLISLSLLVAGVVACFYFGIKISSSVSAQINSVQPFYLQRTISTATPSERLSPTRTEVIARRSDATIVHITSIGPLDSPGYFRRIDFPDGRSVTLVDSIKAKTTWPQKEAANLSGSNSQSIEESPDCSIHQPYRVVRSDKINDQSVVVAEGNVEKRYRVTRWMAPNLGCEDLYYESMAVRPDGTSFISAEAKTSELKLGDPDPSLFDLGSDYTEMKPSAIQSLVLQHLNISLSPADAQKARTEGEQADALYDRAAAPNK